MWPLTNGSRAGSDKPKQSKNFALALGVGSSGCRILKLLLKADARFKSKVFTVVAFVEKNGNNMRQYQKGVEKLGVNKWDSFKPLFFELIGNGEEFEKDPQGCIEEFPIWSKRIEELVHDIKNYDSNFGDSSVLLATITVGGHFFVLLHAVRLINEQIRGIKYRIGSLIVPEDELSTSTYHGALWLLHRFKLFDSIIVWNNNNWNQFRSVEAQDIMSTLNTVTLLHRDAKRQPDISNFDAVSSICKHDDGKTHFYGLSAEVSNVPRLPHPRLLGTRREKDRSRTVLKITNAVRAVIEDKRHDLTGFPWKEGSPIHITITGDLDWQTEVLPGIHDWKGDKRINVKFLPAKLVDGSKDKFSKIVVVALREVVPPDFDDGQVTDFKKCFDDYSDKCGTKKKATEERQPEIEENPETEEQDDLVKMSNFDGEDEAGEEQ